MDIWKGTVHTYSKDKEGIAYKSTKQCSCGNSNLLLLASLNMKICTDCDNIIPWFLESGQSSLIQSQR
jgi:hypothetical protein